MGNTNLPQFGSADHTNSHDTRPGRDQLTKEQKKQVPEKSATTDAPPNPAVTPDEAIAGYVDTGHSPSKAT